MFMAIWMVMALGVSSVLHSCQNEVKNEAEMSDEARMDSLKRELQGVLEKYQTLQKEFEAVADGMEAELESKYLHMVPEYLSDSMKSVEHRHPLCSESQWWVSLPKVEGEPKGFAAVAENLYNTFMASYSISADYEIWYRAAVGGSTLVDSVAVLEGLGKMDFTCIQDDTLREQITRSRDDLVWCISVGMDGWTDDRNPSLCAGRLDKYLSDTYFEKEESGCYLGEELWQVYDLQETDTILQQQFSENWKGVEPWLQSMIQEQDLDRCCQLAIAGIREMGSAESVWCINVTTALLNSGLYSPYLFIIWRMWRADCQQLFGGMSRDSFIYNHFYNQYRNKAFTTVMRHIHQHPEDKLAVGTAQAFMLMQNTIRNGSFLFGNDNALERMSLGMLP